MTLDTQTLRDLASDLETYNVMSRYPQGLLDAADAIDALLSDYDRLREALDRAATSLNTIATLAGSKDDYMEDMFQVRGYAHSRARVARAALQEKSNG